MKEKTQELKFSNQGLEDYHKLLEKVLKYGIKKQDRTGVGTISLFGERLVFDCSQETESFPVLTTKKIHLKSVVHELLWMLSGDTNTKYLRDNGVTIWDEWADENGDLGPVYGSQWRNFDGVDQIKELVEELKHNPNSRRHIVSAWNVGELNQMKLPPCHMMFQCYVDNENGLHMQMIQRSCDLFLGAGFNITFYAMLLHMLAQQTNMLPKTLTMVFGDCHIYLNHVAQVDLLLSRYHKAGCSLNLNKAKDIFSYKYEDFEFLNYSSHPTIKAPVAI